jgi:argininosuccinate lyase
MMSEIQVNEHILEDEKYLPIFSVEEVNRLVCGGTPFRDAYKQVALEIEAGRFHPDTNIHHTHEGSIGNLCNNEIVKLKEEVMNAFHFEKMNQAEEKLLLNRGKK